MEPKYTQAEFMRGYNEQHRELFNDKLFERDNQSIIDAVSKIIYSCERDKYFTLKVLSMRAILNYEEIYNTLRDYEENNRKNGDRGENPYDLINIKDSDIMLLEVIYFIKHNGTERQKIDGKMVDVVDPEKKLQVLIALPRFVRKYYFYLNGNYYNATGQIVDGSTYNNSTANNSKVDSVTMKTMFHNPKVFRMFREMIDVNTGRKDTNIIYTSIIFNNHLDCMFYILAAYGLMYTMDFLGIHNILLSQFPIVREGWSCYQKHNLYLAMPMDCPDPMTQSLLVSIYDAIGKDTTINDLYNQRFWLKNLGMMFKNASVEKGLFILDSIESIYDQIAMEQLQLPPNMKENVYMLLRWMMREFPSLRAKDNVDVTTKKLCIADYIARTYGTKLSNGIHKISDMGKKVTLKNVERYIRIQPMYTIKSIMVMNNLVDYVDMVNDNDATTALKFTYKGIAGLGEDGGSIQPIYRHVDPSHIGILDLDVSSTSDPGMSGMICPMTPIYPGGFFSQYQEPNNWEAQYGYLQQEYYNRRPVESPFVDGQTFEPYDPDAKRHEIIQECLELDKPQCPIFSLNDSNIDFTIMGEMKKAEQPKEVKSLFTIRRDDDE